ncbi:MAG TPA: hypothetical protein VHF45_04205 [Thermoleophilaceae bacterium]|nr:hypothetical protein [Thermoleophilaceae bacterium]
MRGLRAAGFTVACALALGACGGGERQDADEPEGDYRLEVVDARFPAEQSIAERSTMRIRVRNADSKTVPNVAVTVETAPKTPGGASGSFSQNRDDESLADPSRPVWIVDRGPEGGETAYTNTWALGPLRAGQTKTFEWRVTPVVAGRYTVRYQVSPGLDGKAELAGGEGGGEFKVTVDDEPADARIADDGKTVVRE